MRFVLAKRIFILWTILYTSVMCLTFLTDNVEYVSKSLYIYSIMATFPISIIGVYIIDLLGGANFWGISITFYLLGIIQWSFGLQYLVSRLRAFRK